LKDSNVPALFVAATGTEIGKTFVTSGLIAALRRKGRAVTALKPVVTGFDETSFSASDPALLLNACGKSADLESIAAISPWRFAAPLSPDMASAREGRSIDFDALTRYCAAGIATADDALLIEGIGGLMVPFDAASTVCDLIAALDIPLLLVTGTYLGTLSHTLSALEVAQRRGLNVGALVLNESFGSSVSLEDTAASLANFWAGPIFSLGRNQASNSIVFDKLAEILPTARSSVA
jgi:dethiobiotin synthetase